MAASREPFPFLSMRRAAWGLTYDKAHPAYPFDHLQGKQRRCVGGQLGAQVLDIDPVALRNGGSHQRFLPIQFVAGVRVALALVVRRVEEIRITEAKVDSSGLW